MEGMCRLRVAFGHDAPGETLQRTTVLIRRKMETSVPSITAVWTTVLDVPIQETIVPVRPIRGTTCPISPERCAVRFDMSDEDSLQATDCRP